MAADGGRHALAVSSSDAVESIARADALARALGLPLLGRGRRSLRELLVDAEILLIIGADGPRLCDAAGELRYSLGMGALRRLRVGAGEPDGLVRAAGLRAGDRVLDATLGLGQDAAVAARAVGPTGAVVGIEASLPLFALAYAGVAFFATDPLACPVQVRHGDAAMVLPMMDAGAFDIVVLDPMFDRPTRAQPGFEVLRRHALERPLDAGLVTAARRVARRSVVIKGPRRSAAWAALGVDPALAAAALAEARAGSPHRKVLWVRLPGAGEASR